MTDAAIISDIFNYVRKNGTLVRKAQSCWGADRWTLETVNFSVDVTLEDDGYTYGIFSIDVKVRQTYNQDPVYMFGDTKKLVELYKEIVK